MARRKIGTPKQQVRRAWMTSRICLRKQSLNSWKVALNQTSIPQDMGNKIISMYAKGMSTSDIEAHIQDIYSLDVSDTTVSRVS